MIESIESRRHIPISIQFPSFAPSLQTSPKIQKSRQSSTFQSFNSPQIHKISIHLPEQLFEENDNNQQTNLGHNFLKERGDDNLHKKQEWKIDNTTGNIRVFCRMRKPNKFEDSLKYDSTMIDDGENCYSFDYIFNKNVVQRQIYERIALRHVDDFFVGKNSTIFAYGQTGSGKTYTMFGNMNKSTEYGLIPRALEQMFKRDLSNSTITCSMLEIYNQKLFDLFNPLTNSSSEIKLKQANDNIYLEGLQQVLVQNQDQVLNLIKVGHRGRKTAATFSNDFSSRSHTILFVYRNFICKGQQYRCKLCFIDLAGSEKVKKSGAKGQTLEQTKKINLSLSCLGNVIHSLTNGSDHIPYRNSKLTRILKDSLATDTSTSVITTCSLDKLDHNQTISTIKFATRAKKIKNKKKLENEQITIQQQFVILKKQLEQTKKQLAHYKQSQKQFKLFGSSQSSTSSQIPTNQIDYKKKQDSISSKSQKKQQNNQKKFPKKTSNHCQFETYDENPTNQAQEVAQQSISLQPIRTLYITKGVSSRIQVVNCNQNQHIAK